MLASALGGTPAEMDEETPVEMEMRRREVRVGDRLVRSLHLGKWPRSLAPRLPPEPHGRRRADGPVHPPGVDSR